MTTSTFEAASFDAAGTLIHLAEPVGLSYARVARAHGIDADPKALNASFSRCWKEVSLPFTSTDLSRARDERSWWRALVLDVFEQAGYLFQSDLAYSNFFDALYLHFESPGTWLPNKDASNTLERLADEFPLVILSNFDSRLRRILDDLALLSYFDTLFISCEQKLSKPDPELFARVARYLELKPERIVHVGDDPICDWKGATSAGFGLFKTGKNQPPLRALLRQLSLA
ncbi:MAG: HAD-IA family hydrolase [Verrucomicrobiota bacterium]